MLNASSTTLINAQLQTFLLWTPFFNTVKNNNNKSCYGFYSRLTVCRSISDYRDIFWIGVEIVCFLLPHNFKSAGLIIDRAWELQHCWAWRWRKHKLISCLNNTAQEWCSLIPIYLRSAAGPDDTLLWNGAFVRGSPITFKCLLSTWHQRCLDELIVWKYGCCSRLVDLCMHVYRTPHRFLIMLSVLFFLLCIAVKQVLKCGHNSVNRWRWPRWLSLLSFVPEMKTVFHQKRWFLIIWTGLRPRKSAGCLFVLCSQMKLSDGWKRFQHLCIVKKIQCNVIFNARMLITDIIKALMSLLLPALLLQHLFNPERYCPYGALGSLKIPTLGDHLLLWAHCTFWIANFSIRPYYLP